MKFAAIDIGSNSIKLVVLDVAASDSLAVLAREKEIVRLDYNTLREGFPSADNIRRATECSKRFRSIAEVRGVKQLNAIATAAVREVMHVRLRSTLTAIKRFWPQNERATCASRFSNAGWRLPGAQLPGAIDSSS